MENESRLGVITCKLEESYRGRPSLCDGWYKYAKAGIAMKFHGVPQNKPSEEDLVEDLISDLLTKEKTRNLIDFDNFDKSIRKQIAGRVSNACRKKQRTRPMCSLKRSKGQMEGEEEIEPGKSTRRMADPNSLEFLKLLESYETIKQIRRMMRRKKMVNEIIIFNCRIVGKKVNDASEILRNPIAVNRMLVKFLKNYIIKHPL